jgi:hypothetical protein
MKDPNTQPELPKPKKRVSHRKELAVVTLAMVASISGVGGLLAANQSAYSQTASSASKPAVSAPARHDGAGGKHLRFLRASWRDDDGREVGDDGSGYAVVGPVKRHQASNGAPSFSPRLHRSPSAVSQGSPPVR